MEVTPEFFEFFTELGILETHHIKLLKDGAVTISDNILERLLDFEFFDKVLLKLESTFNEYYKVQLNFIDKIRGIKKNISMREVRLENWRIIGGVLENFGIQITEDIVNRLASRDKTTLVSLLKTIYLLCEEIARRKGKPIKEETIKGPNDVYVPEVKPVDFSSFSTNKAVQEANSPLEFFLITLGKALDMSTKQVASLLSNNRKYLIHIANKGIKKDFTKIRDWFHLLRSNELRILTLLNKSEESNIDMCLSTIGVGLLSKDIQTATLSFQLVSEISESIDNNWRWFNNEGIELFVFCICKHESIRIPCLNLMFDFCNKNKSNELGDIIIARISKEKIYEFMGVLFEFIHNCHPKVKNSMLNFIVDYCFKEEGSEKSTAMSLISEAWIYAGDAYFSESKESLVINFFKVCIRDSLFIIQKSALSQLFRLLSHFAKLKNRNGPIIYKLLSFLFLENYNNPILKEEFISSFIYVFKTIKSIPVDIMLNPYLSQLKTSTNYSVNDFTFLNFIVDHPKIKEEQLREIVNICCNISLTDIFYGRPASELFSILLEKITIDFDIVEFFINFIKNSLHLFLKYTDNLILLEVPYSIMQLEIPDIITEMEPVIVEVNEKYYHQHKSFSMGLLSLLWFYEVHDEVLLRCNEKSRVKYPPLGNSAKVQENLYLKSPEYVIDQIMKKRFENENKKLYEIYNQREKENTLNVTLMKQLGMNTSEITGKEPTYLEKISNRNFIVLKEGQTEEHRKGEKFYFKPLLPIVDLLDEEPRETKAINSLKLKYKTNIGYFFKEFQNAKGNSINKPNLLKLLRHAGIDINILTVENLSDIIRSLYGIPLNTFDYDKFLDLCVHISYFIYSKIRPSDSISQNFDTLCKQLVLPKKQDSLELIALKSRLSDNPDVILPPGFRKILVPDIKYNFFIPNCIKSVIGRSKTTVIELLNEIIEKALNTHIIESFIEINDKVNVEENVLKKSKWRLPIFNAASSLSMNEENIELRPYISEAADVLEKLLHDVESKSKIQERRISPKTKIYMQLSQEYQVEEENKSKKRELRMQFLKNKISDYKKEVMEQTEKEKKERIDRKLKEEENLKKQILLEREEAKKTKKQIEENKKLKEQEVLEKENEKKQKLEKKLKEQEKEKELFFTNQKKKLKEQFKEIVTHQKEVKEHELDQINNIKEIDIKKIFNKEKEQVVFEKNMNMIAESILNRKDIKELFFRYETNLRTVFDIYSQNKFDSYIRYNEFYAISFETFKNFLTDFSVLGLLINKEQMNFIFKKVARRHNDNIEEDHFFLNYNDFLITILYLSIYSKYTNKSIRIMPSDFQKADMNTILSFFDFLGFVVPCNKIDLENFINDRRALNTKQLNVLRKIYKQEIIPKIIKPEYKPNKPRKFKMDEKYEAFNKVREEKFREAMEWERKLKERERKIIDGKKSPMRLEKERRLRESRERERNEESKLNLTTGGNSSRNNTNDNDNFKKNKTTEKSEKTSPKSKESGKEKGKEKEKKNEKDKPKITEAKDNKDNKDSKDTARSKDKKPTEKETDRSKDKKVTTEKEKPKENEKDKKNSTKETDKDKKDAPYVDKKNKNDKPKK